MKCVNCSNEATTRTPESKTPICDACMKHEVDREIACMIANGMITFEDDKLIFTAKGRAQ